jgi:hypothetical protein
VGLAHQGKAMTVGTAAPTTTLAVVVAQVKLDRML